MANLIDLYHELRRHLAPVYEGKDTMHDLSHIDRITKRALELSDEKCTDIPLLRCAALLHGVGYSHESDVRELFKEEGIPESVAADVVSVAWESQKESPPISVEGKLLHDAHLLEGDENFLITKALVTGSLRGQSLRTTAEYIGNHLGAYKCAIPENQEEYERREIIASEYLAKLLKEL